MSFTISSIGALLRAYRSGEVRPRDVLAPALKRLQADQHRAWIQLIDEAALDGYLQLLEQKNADDLPLYGVPFAIKDNIDLAGVPTTAACPAFAYTPEASAPVVQALIDAGAVPLGKTNLDQFATGLVGTRSPYGACRNSLNPDYVSGGSSAGSAVAVALGQVSFALGTDTAGSGRVPAAFNNLIGLKPSRGLLSTRGVVPACASLDCVTVFANRCEDATRVFDVAARFDPEDPWSRRNPYGNGPRYFSPSTSAFTYARPLPEQLEFFGDEASAEAFTQACDALAAIGGEAVEMDFSPFFDAARLLYEGPWVAERYLAVQDILELQPQSLLPVIRQIIEPAAHFSATQTFAAQYTLQGFRQQAASLLEQVDVLVTPTAATCYTIDQVQADPMALNARLGYYTNFMNLLDLAAVAVPTGFLPSGVGFGLTLFQRALSDKYLLSVAGALQHHLAIAPGNGANGSFQAEYELPTAAVSGTTPLVVCGAHLEGLPLNWQLLERGACLLERTRSAAAYKLYALAGGPPRRPAMVRDSGHGAAIEVEIWQIPLSELGSFVAEIPPPLGIGKVEVEGGRWLPGFICEGSGIAGAEDISAFGGWRAWLASL